MIKDREIALQILNMMDTALECIGILGHYLAEGRGQSFAQLSGELAQLIASIQRIAPGLKEEEDGLNLPAASESVQVSLQRIILYGQTNPALALHKMEFELVPLIREMKMAFYFWGTCYPDPERMEQYYSTEMYKLNRNPYLEEAEAGGSYKYDLSIIVMAYNKLSYTKSCVQSVLDHLPEGLTYELILLNHGSTDGTKEYFETIKPDKQMDIAVNGGGANAILRALEGKYYLVISNDVIVTPDAIKNLYLCIDSDPSIAWAVPSTSNVSNCQELPLLYEGIEGLQEAARENNRHDPFRHEQRVRLCNPMDIKRLRSVFELQLTGYLYSKTSAAFPDDVFSLLTRRGGYKMYQAKDAYCHHFGSVTLKEEIGSRDIYTEGRIEFKRRYGFDPWGIGFCYDPGLFALLTCDDRGHTDILAINCGLGSNALKIKESIKEAAHNTDVAIYGYGNEPEYCDELIAIYDKVTTFSSWLPLQGDGMPEAFDYIVIERFPEESEFAVELLSRLYGRLSPTGCFIIKVSTPGFLAKAEGILPSSRRGESYDKKTWVVSKKI